MAVVPFAPVPKLAVHIDPIMAALPEIGGEDIALVASYNSLVQAKRRGFRRIVLAQHGAGQSYGGDSRSTRNPGYPGGDKNDAVGLFLCPNEYSADRWQRRYPAATVRVVGCPRLDSLPERQRTGELPRPLCGTRPLDDSGRMESPSVHASTLDHTPVIALSWHWNAYFSPEANSAYRDFAHALPELARHWTVIGTGHPQRNDMRWRYDELGIEYVADFDEVCRRADVLVADNTSAMFEFAASGRNVVVLNARQYRREVHHGGRFWDWTSVGPVVDDWADLADAVEVALSGPWPERDLVLDEVYQPRLGGARLAAEAIVEWAA